MEHLDYLAINQDGAEIFPTFNVQYLPKPERARSDSPSRWMATPTETINHRNPWKEIATLGDQPAGWYRITFYLGRQSLREMG